MKNPLIIVSAALLITTQLMAQKQKNIEWKPEMTEVWNPEPKIIDPGNNATPPSDAVILFNGNDLAQWESVKDRKPAEWTINNGVLTVKPGSGDIQTKESFGDIQLHVEWRTPAKVEGEGQGRGNSGIFLQNRYEVQILDSYNNRTYSNGQAGSIYKQHIPLVNASKGPGEWQTYDIIYSAPVFSEQGAIKYPARITVIHNGVVIQNHIALQGTTEYIGPPKNISHGDGQIVLQDHGNPVSFRNIWLRKL